jgi:O-antigen/teichoic acid export membrane protein
MSRFNTLFEIYSTRLTALAASPTVRFLLKNSFWSVSGAIFLQGLTFIAYIIVARSVDKETFGDFGLFKSTVNTFAMYALLGIGMTTTKYISEWLPKNKADVGRLISLNYTFAILSGIAFSLLFYFLIPWFCEYMINAPHLNYTLHLGIVLLFLTTFLMTQIGILAGFQDFKSIAITSIAMGLLMILLFTCGTRFGGLYGLVFIMIISALLNIIMNAYFVRQNKRKYGIVYKLRGCSSLFPILWKFCLPSTLNGFLGGPIIWICYLVLARQVQGHSELAVFTAALQLYFATTFIQSQIWRVFFSSLSESHGQQNLRKYWRMVQFNLILNVIISAIIVIPVILLASRILCLYGSSYTQGSPVLITLCFSSIAFSLYCIPSQILNSRGKAWESFIIGTCGSIAMLKYCYAYDYLLVNSSWIRSIGNCHRNNGIQCVLSRIYVLMVPERKPSYCI